MNMDLSLKIVLTLVISLRHCFAIEVSKACSGRPGLPCTSHNLKCSSGRIAIREAFYLRETACGVFGVSDCDVTNVSSIPLDGTRYNFSDTELDSVYTDCSRQSTCSTHAAAGWQFPASFSAIIYQCIEETFNICNATVIQRSDTALIWRGPSNQNKCVCFISKAVTSGQTFTYLTAFDMHQHCPTLTVLADGDIYSFPCLNFTSSRYRFNKTDTIEVKVSVNTTINEAVFWIGLKGTENLNKVCNERPTTTEVDDESNTGTIVGVIIPLCIIIVGVVTAVIIYRRRKVKTLKIGKSKSNLQEEDTLE